ncbi:U3 small nucleolar ribonucleoprotein complex, subunit Mpp10 [Podospora didyma]|uniref:U3 small nucleolar ribonucleoprotein protein MPP10 n=1 Tax=Podospora didyma TaxID=330526 RepID=A0AAE0TVP7_9PEZI|nr:U3 small nucleolar ribonucleoprotein complex, subunit Mpp10 [Podospora didyma]
MAPAASTGPEVGSAAAVFLESIDPSNRHVFLRPSPLISTGSLQLAKETLDSLAVQVSDQQQLRLRDAGKKRKREVPHDMTDVLKIRKLHIDGFETGQVWQQAKKIIASALDESSRLLEELEEGYEVEEGTGENATLVEFGEDGFEIGSDEGDSVDASSASDDEADTEDSDDDDDDGASISNGEDTEMIGDDISAAEDDDDDEDDEEEDDEEDVEKVDEEEEEDDDNEPVAEFAEDPDGLNDGFFLLDEFNKQTQMFEAQDARADPNTDNFSDDESVDWHADPMSEGKAGKKTLHALDDEEDDLAMDDGEDEEDAPPLGMDVDRIGEADDGDDLGLGIEDANDLYYKDFFAPPQRKSKTGNQRKPRVFPQPKKPDEADIERAENDVRRDLFEDHSEHSDSEDALSDVSAGNPKSRRSALARRQAKVAEEIRKLESELVAKRAWTLSGEAKAVDRPVNSLLEEDLDFEHVGKPIPIVTEEVSESIEALIKRRILAREFDELIRRRPDTFGNSNGARRGLVEVEDTKGKKGLAELYEEEHIKKSNPDSYVSQADEKVKADEDEIKRMWLDISAKLDSLSSWHYKPKPAAPTLNIVADVATIAMEDAQPTTAQGVAGGESMIAPQEVYAPGKESAEQGEVIAKSGLPIARQEMTREEKLRRRRRDKERIRKAGGVDANNPMSKKKQAEKEAMSDLKKGGVRVINRKGEMVGLDGKKTAEHKVTSTSGSFKL